MIVDAWGRVGEGGGVISRKVGAVNPPMCSSLSSIHILYNQAIVEGAVLGHF